MVIALLMTARPLMLGNKEVLEVVTAAELFKY